MSLDASATQYASSMDVNLVRNVFVPSYTFDGSLGQFVVQLDTNLRGNVTVGDNTTNYALTVNGSVVQTISSAANWSTIPAIQTVNMNGFGLCNISIGSALGPQSLYYNPSTQLITYSTTPSGGGITLPPGSNWANYLYWNGTAYVVGDQNITLGANAGLSGQLSNAIAIGRRAGESNQRQRAVAIGRESGLVSQGEESVAVGAYTGSLSQEWYAVAVGGYAGQTEQGLATVAVGWSAGSTSQGSYAVSVGSYAGGSGQGQNAIAIGRNAGKVNQISNSIILNATGLDFANTAYRTVSGFYVDPVRSNAGPSAVYYDSTTKEITYGPTVSGGLTIPTGTYFGDYLRWNPATSAYVVASRSITLGGSAGVNQGDLAVAIGFEAGCNAQVNNAIAIGTRAGRTGQSQDGIAIGRNAADAGQGESSIAIGTFAAQGTPQHSNSIVISALGGTALITSNANAFYVAPVRSNVGTSAVYYDSTTKEMTYGPTVSAGLTIPTGAYFGDYLYWNSNSNAYLVGSTNITLGRNAGQTTQGANAVALGNYAGNTNQRSNAVSIGNHDDGVYNQSNQGVSAVSIGRMTGTVSQGTQAVSIGDGAGYLNQGLGAVAIGAFAGLSGQFTQAIAIGTNSGYSNQGSDSIAIGTLAGNVSQGGISIAIGYGAGNSNQGTNSIAIGYLAANVCQHPNSIVLNTTGGPLNTQYTNSFYVGSVRTDTTTSGIYGLGYNDGTKEIVKTAVNAVQTISLGTGLSNSGTAQNPIINVTISGGGVNVARTDSFQGNTVGFFNQNATLFTYTIPVSWLPASSGVNVINITTTFGIKCYDNTAGNAGKDGGGVFETYATSPRDMVTFFSGDFLIDNGGLITSQKNMPCTLSIQLVRGIHWSSNKTSIQCDFTGFYGIYYAINHRQIDNTNRPYNVYVTTMA